MGRPYKKADPHLYESILTNGDEEKAIEFAAFRIEQHKRDGKAALGNVFCDDGACVGSRNS